MKRAAAFLLILLLATLVGITTSYGIVPGDTDSSHLVHTDANLWSEDNLRLLPWQRASPPV